MSETELFEHRGMQNHGPSPEQFIRPEKYGGYVAEIVLSDDSTVHALTRQDLADFKSEVLPEIEDVSSMGVFNMLTNRWPLNVYLVTPPPDGESFNIRRDRYLDVRTFIEAIELEEFDEADASYHFIQGFVDYLYDQED